MQADDWHTTLCWEIAELGFYTTSLENMGSWSRITICSLCVDGVKSGNSFWLTPIKNEWALGTWAGIIYAMPSSMQVVGFVSEWFAICPRILPYDFDETLKRKFKLRELTDEEFEFAISSNGNDT